MARRVLVTGGSGFVGAHLCARLAGAGDTVIVPTRRREGAKALLPLPTASVIEADIHDPPTLERLVSGCDTVVNLVGILHESRTQTFDAVHVQLVERLIAACRKAGVQRLIHMSALAADPAAPSRYLQSKGRAEALVRDSGLAWTLFRPSVIFGRGDAFLGMFAKLVRVAPIVPLAAAGARFQPVFVGDVAHCFAHAVHDAATVRHCYDLAGPEVLTLREIVAFVMETTGHVRPIVPLGAGLSSMQARVLELLPGKLMTRDNLASMRVDNVARGPFPAVFGIVPGSMRALAPGWLAPAALQSRFEAFRAQSGR